MVKLNRIYTKTGDAGTTGLGDGKRVAKDHLRVEAYGTVDEANAFVGLAVIEADRAGAPARAVADLLRSIQHDLFDVGADLCCPPKAGEKPGERLRILPDQTARLEQEIDRYNDPLPALNSFVLPGGTPLAAALHAARTVVRRAERCVVSLRAADAEHTGEETIRYLNRLSDLLFVLARVANQAPPRGVSAAGAGDVLWLPGANRPK